jgi:hypothetical protein
MTEENIILALEMASTVFGALAWVGWRLVQLSIAFGQMRLKVDTMWEFQVRRAAVQAVNRGLAVMNSPLRPTEEAVKWFAGLDPKLQEADNTRWKALPEHDMLLAIEREFGEEIMKEVCIPHNLWDASCLIIAACVAQGIEPVSDEMTTRRPLTY